MEKNLAERLAGLSKAHKEQKQEAAKESLQPVYDRIKDIEKQKYDLENISASLHLPSVDLGFQGIKGHADKSVQDLQSVSATMDTMLEENKDALEAAGITDRDTLAKEFSDTLEAQKYNEAKQESDNVKIDSQKLQSKLQELGIELTGENERLDYKQIGSVIEQKLLEVNSELAREKVKTPEGRQEAVDLLVEKFKSKVLLANFKENNSGKVSELSLTPSVSYYPDEVVRVGLDTEKLSFPDWDKAHLLPANFAESLNEHDKTIVTDAVKQAYNLGIERSMAGYDKEHGDTSAWKDFFENYTYDDCLEAGRELDKFERKCEEFKEKVEEKLRHIRSEAEGISFNNARGVIRKMSEPFYNTDIDRVRQKLTSSSYNKIPPVYDYKMIKEKLEERLQQNQEFLEDLESLKDNEDYKKFFIWDDSKENQHNIASYHSRVLETSDKSDFIKLPQVQRQDLENLKKRYASIEDFKRDIEQKSFERSQVKKKSVDIINQAVDLSVMKYDLNAEIIKTLPRSNVESIESDKSHFERNKKDAEEYMQTLVRYEADLPQEKLVFEKGFVIIPSIQERLLETERDIDQIEKELKINQSSLNNMGSRPKIFGRQKWDNDMTILQSEKEGMATKKKELEQLRNKLDREQKVRISLPDNSQIDSWVRNHKRAEGFPGEIFSDVKSGLQKMIDTEYPKAVLDMKKEYDEKVRKIL